MSFESKKSMESKKHGGVSAVHYPRTSHKDRQSHRSVKFSHSMVVGGGGLHKDIVDLADTNEADDENVMNVTTARSPQGSANNSPRHSGGNSLTRDRKYSIDAPNDLIGFGMSSFLSTRDSLEVAAKKGSKSPSKAESEVALREHLSKLVAEINAGKLGPIEMRQLNNFAQKLINAHQAGELIGKPPQGTNQFDVEVIYDATPSSDKSVSNRGSDRPAVTDNINSLIGDIRANRLTSVQIADLALSIVEISSQTADELKQKFGSLGLDANKPARDAIIGSLQSSLRGIDGRVQATPSPHSPAEPESNTISSRVKWHEEPESQHLIRILHKLKGQMILAPSGGSFVESIEKVIKDVDEDLYKNYFYDAMVLSLCLIVTYQEWQNSHGEEGVFWKRTSRTLTKFDTLAGEIIVSMFQRTTSGMGTEEYSMEDLIRLTTLVASCDFINPQPGHPNLAGSENSNHSTLSKDQEDNVIVALMLMKKLFPVEKATIKDLMVIAKGAYKLQSKSLGNMQSTHSIWTVRKSSSRLMNHWSLPPTQLVVDDQAVEPNFISSLREKLNSLKDKCGSVELLQATLQMTESALTVLTRQPHLTDFFAASLVLVVALVFERIKAEYFTAALDYKVLDLLINNLVFEAFNVALKRLQSQEIELDAFQYLTATITKYREQATTTSTVFGVSPRPTLNSRDHSSQAVASPYAVMDFLEKSLQVMKNPPSDRAAEVRALAEYALCLQGFYGQEVLADKDSNKISPVQSDVRTRKWSGVSSADQHSSPSQTVTPNLILEHLDTAIDKVRQQDTAAKDLLSIACFVTYLVEIPEKLARDEEPNLPKGMCTLQEYEQRLVKIRKITHYIPRFDFIIKNLEKTLNDLKNGISASYNYDLILLSMCIFIAYEWIRTEPLSVFSVTKLDDRAANVIYEAMQSTLRGIKSGALAMEDLQNLTSIITNTTDLRRASAVNVSTRENARRQSSVMPGPPPRVLVNDAMVLEFIDELVINDANSSNLNVEKLNKILTAMQSGAVSSYLYELLVLSICVAASRKALVLSDDCISTQEKLKAMPKPDKEMHEFAVKTIKRTIDGLRSGCVHEDEVRNLTNFIVKQTKESIVKPQQLKTAASRLTTKGAELAGLLMGITGATSNESTVGNQQATAISKILDFFSNLGNMAAELGSSLTDLTSCHHSYGESHNTSLRLLFSCLSISATLSEKKLPYRSFVLMTFRIHFSIFVQVANFICYRKLLPKLC